MTDRGRQMGLLLLLEGSERRGSIHSLRRDCESIKTFRNSPAIQLSLGLMLLVHLLQPSYSIPFGTSVPGPPQAFAVSPCAGPSLVRQCTVKSMCLGQLRRISSMGSYLLRTPFLSFHFFDSALLYCCTVRVFGQARRSGQHLWGVLSSIFCDDGACTRFSARLWGESGGFGEVAE